MDPKFSKSLYSETGAAFVETAISFLFFASLIFLTADILRLSLQTVTAEYAVNRAIRDFVVQQGSPEYRAKQLNCWVKYHFAQFGFMNDVRDELDIRICGVNNITSAPGNQLCNDGSLDAGGYGELVSLEVSFSGNFLWNLMEVPVRANALVRNEPDPIGNDDTEDLNDVCEYILNEYGLS